MPTKIEIPNLANLLARYTAGESEQKLAREAGVNRWTFRQRIIQANIRPRNVSDSMFIRWSNATEAQRSSMLTNAHIATRGRIVSNREKILRAASREKNCTGASRDEIQLANWLEESGIGITRQKAIDIYNLDIAINELPIAIEIFGGNWHSTGAHKDRFFKRSKYLFNLGWSLIVIWIDNGIINPQCADYIIRFINAFRENPPSISQYRVILGNGNPAPVCKSYLNTPPIIERLGHCQYFS